MSAADRNPAKKYNLSACGVALPVIGSSLITRMVNARHCHLTRIFQFRRLAFPEPSPIIRWQLTNRNPVSAFCGFKTGSSVFISAAANELFRLFLVKECPTPSLKMFQVSVFCVDKVNWQSARPPDRLPPLHLIGPLLRWMPKHYPRQTPDFGNRRPLFAEFRGSVSSFR